VQQRETAKPTQEPARRALQLGRRQRLLAFGLAAPVAVLLHAGIVLAALDWSGRVDPGSIPDPSETISVELAASQTIDALTPERTSEPAPSLETPAPVAGSATPTKPVEAADTPEKHEPVEQAGPAPAPDADDTETRAADGGEPPDTPPGPAVLAAPAAETPPDAVPEPPKAPLQGQETQAKPKEARKAEKKVAQPLGGIVSKAKAGKGTGSGKVSASTGSMLAYANLVRARVAPNRSNETGTAGTAVVAFGLTSTGALAYARVARSSGNATNDGIALAVVRGAAPFPTPPPGATPGQLQFTVPYYFQ
jgi:periplasmic protein TonB